MRTHPNPLHSLFRGGKVARQSATRRTGGASCFPQLVAIAQETRGTNATRAAHLPRTIMRLVFVPRKEVPQRPPAPQGLNGDDNAVMANALRNGCSSHHFIAKQSQSSDDLNPIKNSFAKSHTVAPCAYKTSIRRRKMASDFDLRTFAWGRPSFADMASYRSRLCDKWRCVVCNGRQLGWRESRRWPLGSTISAVVHSSRMRRARRF